VIEERRSSENNKEIKKMSVASKKKKTTISDFSREGRKIIHFMIGELSSLKYGHMDIIYGCYDAAINNYGYPKTPEKRKEISSFVADRMKTLKTVLSDKE